MKAILSPREKNKTLALLAMGFLIILVYELLRPIKTALLVTAEGSGANIIPYLRIWVVFPSALLMAVIFSQLSRHLNRSQIFYGILGAFLTFFLIFILILYPYQKHWELGSMVDYFLSPGASKTFFLIIKYWHLSLFFIFAELWTTAVLSILFWGYVNEMTSLNEAKKLYGVILLVGNSAVIFAGCAGQVFTTSFLHWLIPFGGNPWDKTVYGTLILVLFLGLAVVSLFSYLDHPYLGPQGHQKQVSAKTPPKKQKINLKGALKSPPLLYLTFIVIASNISYPLIEVLWISKLHQAYPDPRQMSAYISRVLSVTGLFSLLLALLVCPRVIQRFGWTVTALITPVIWIITGVAFLLAVLLEGHFLYQMVGAFCELTPLLFSVLIGATHMSLGRASKYTLFDQSKEMSFIPLPPEIQRAGKVWIESIVSWAGKLGGALIYQLCLLVCYKENFVLCILGIFLILLFIWINSVRLLGKKMGGKKMPGAGRERQFLSSDQKRSGLLPSEAHFAKN